MGRAPQGVRESQVPPPSCSLQGLVQRNVTGPPGLHQLGPDQSRKQFPRPPSSQGQQACPDLGQAQAALGFVSPCLETSRGHLILPLTLSSRPLTAGVSQSCPASPGLLFPLAEAVLPPVLSLVSPTAIFRPSLLVWSPHFLEIQSLCERVLMLLLSHLPTSLWTWESRGGGLGARLWTQTVPSPTSCVTWCVTSPCCIS